MKKQSFLQKNSRQKRIISIVVCLLILFCYEITLSSCSVENTKTFNNLLVVTTTENTDNPAITSTKTPKIAPTIYLPTTGSPESQTASSYSFLDLDLSTYQRTIEVTQGPVFIDSTNDPTDDFLYKDVKVTVRLGNGIDVFTYLDLDNLEDKGISNSDILIERTGASYVWRIIEPINNAVYYYSENPAIDFNGCLSYFPIQEKDPTEYWMQGMEFDLKGGTFCVITNEDRMAIVKYMKNSEKYNDDYTMDISFMISVYKTILK